MALPTRPENTPQATLVRSLVWTLSSVLFLDVAWNRILDLKTAGRAVSPFRYAQVVFWCGMVPFWAWQLWNGWQRYRALKAGPASKVI